MDRQTTDDLTPLIPRSGIPYPVRDIRETYQKQLAVYLILASTLFERISFYVLAANLALLADPEDCPSTAGPIAILIFTGTSNISTLIFAVISDWKLGRARTIIVGYILYFIGYIVLIIATSGSKPACPSHSGEETVFSLHSSCAQWLVPALVVIAIGAGAVQSNTAVFGAEQIPAGNIGSRFFDKYVLAVNIGAICAKFSFIHTQPSTDQFDIPYVYGASVLLIAALLFLIGCRYYIHVDAGETVITRCIPVTINAFQSWHQHHRTKRSKRTSRQSASTNLVYNLHIVTEDDEAIRMDQQVLTFLDYAKAINKGKYIERIVEDVKSLRGAFAVFILLIPYWLIYDQLNSTFRLQARYMQGTDSVSMVLVSVADPAILIIGMLILNLFLYKYLEQRNHPISIPTKFVIGMCFGVLTMGLAGSMEILRQNQWESKISNLNIYYAIPQGLSMGLSELFVMVASFEYAYFAAPRSAQTLFMSLRFCAIGLSSFIGTGYIAALRTKSSTLDFSCRPVHQGDKWLYSAYFYILGGIQLIFILIFILCQKKFEVIKLNRQKVETGHFLRHSPFTYPT